MKLGYLSISYVSMAMISIHSSVVTAEQQTPVMNLNEMIVTTTGRGESLSQIASTVQVISEEKIKRSSARSVTDLLAENAIGFFSEWTPAQTSINIRGGATDGQGRDFRSQTLVLINGRRAGTANISKLSLNDLARVEIIRGPASVAYGSQAMGGVINIITRTGSNTSGSSIKLTGGSWGLMHGHAHTAYQGENTDFYFGMGAGERDDYESGRGSRETMYNTDYERRSALLAAGVDLNDFHRLDLTIRTDGTYNAGFRGSSWAPRGDEDRVNHSIDLIYDGESPQGELAWNVHGYIVRDSDHFKWENRTFLELDNERVLDIYGLRLLTEWRATDSTELRVGADFEYSELRNDRLNTLRSTGNTVRVAPFDKDQDEEVTAIWGEVIQTALNDNLTLRAGGRYTEGEIEAKPTKGVEDLISRAENYEEFTYSLGAAYRLTDQIKLRAGYATGFRAPTASELSVDYVTFAGDPVVGNPSLDNETSRQYELGLSFTNDWLFGDFALFDNRIRDRIVGVELPGPDTFENNDGDIEIQGLDIQLQADLSSLLEDNYNWQVYANGTYHFHMQDEGADPAANTDRAQRIHEYQAGIGTTLSKNQWKVSLTGILRGPVWYDTEERLLIPETEPRRNEYMHKKSAFWVFNLRGSYQVNQSLNVFAGVDNLLDKNEHPLFIALNEPPYISDPDFSSGGRGNSMPGRAFYAGLKLDF